MFEAKLRDAATLRKIVDAIKDLITDAPLDCTDTAISIQAMDSSHVALVSLKLDDAGFDKYRCDRAMNAGINLNNWAKAMRCSNSGDSCTIRLTDQPETIQFIFDGNNRQQEVEIKLMELDMDQLGIPNQEYDCVVEMSAMEFQKVCRDLKSFTESLQIVATKSGLEFSGKGDSGSSVFRYHQTATIDDKKKGRTGVKINLKQPVNITFAIKYMESFTKATGLSNIVRLSMSNDVPIVVEYPIIMGGRKSSTKKGVKKEEMDEEQQVSDDNDEGDDQEEIELGTLKFFLAPKIEDEDMAER